MGLEFGNLPIRIRKVAYYTLGSSDQKFWVKFFSHNVPNLVKNGCRAMVTMVPALALSTFCVVWAPKEHRRSKRKDPRMYENDT